MASRPEEKLIPHLFRTEYRKIVSVLCKSFGLQQIEIAEDIVSETFYLAIELWGLKGIPTKPTAWLYAVSKNKVKDYLKRDALFRQKIIGHLGQAGFEVNEVEIDLSNKNINDSQLQMIFALCHPSIPQASQISLALNVLCGFGVDEIADAFLCNKETIYKRLSRAKEKLKTENIKITLPEPSQIFQRLETVLKTLYLLFSEGYYSTCQNQILRKEVCLEAIRLNLMLLDNKLIHRKQTPCFH